uniref:WGS project CBMI000000000 data, contig CS3069_c000978 n=1 Tax=Fusarium clavum TaxID=2594811 RepID=A0A090MB87_9HYPO|nr:unnamed protein product [Fusarium clavum]
MLRCHLSLYNEELRVLAINRLSMEIMPSVMKSDPHASDKHMIFNELLIGKGLWSLQKRDMGVQISTLDLLDGVPTEVQDACLDHVFEEDKKRVQQYFGKLHLGLGLVSGPPGTGKSHLASIIVILMCFNKSIKKIYVTAASNGAADNILDRIDGMARRITDNLQGDFKHLMLVRGYSFSTEVDNCIMALLGNPFKQGSTWNPSPWRFDRSLCWWTLRALGAKDVPPLTEDDNAEIWELHRNLNSLTCSKFRVGCLPAPQPTLQSKDSEAVNGACGQVYQSFNDAEARAVVFDEAATMFCSDALMVYGNTPRPMIAIGDPKQLAPSLTTAFEILYGDSSKRGGQFHDDYTDNGHAKPKPKPTQTNRFATFVRISWLSWFIHLGWPVFHLYTQHRMAEGLFDLSLNTVYYNLKPYFKYSPLCNPINFSLGLKVEEYLKSEHRIPSADTSQPVFFNCLDCKCVERPDGISRINLRQADLIAKFLVKMIDKLQLPTEDIVVLTPYRANMAAIGGRFGDENELKSVTVSTFSRFQGREAHVVILALCVDRMTGPLFVADPLSLNVALTRQRSSLLIFGDIETTRDKAARALPEGLPKFNQGMINDVFRLIPRSGRVVTVYGDESVGHFRFGKGKKPDTLA